MYFCFFVRSGWGGCDFVSNINGSVSSHKGIGVGRFNGSNVVRGWGWCQGSGCVMQGEQVATMADFRHNNQIISFWWQSDGNVNGRGTRERGGAQREYENTMGGICGEQHQIA